MLKSQPSSPRRRQLSTQRPIRPTTSKKLLTKQSRRIFSRVASSLRHTLATIGEQPFHQFLSSRRVINGVQERSFGLAGTRALQRFVDITRPLTPAMRYTQVSYPSASSSTYATAYKALWLADVESQYQDNLKRAMEVYADHLDGATYPTKSASQQSAVKQLQAQSGEKVLPPNAAVNNGGPIKLPPPFVYDFSRRPGGIVYDIDDHSEGMTIYGPSMNWHPNNVVTAWDLLFNPKLLRQQNVPFQDIRLNELMWNPIQTGEEIPQDANVVFYIHGGSFVLGSPRWVPYQLLSHNWASLLNGETGVTMMEAEKFGACPEKKWYVIAVNYHLSPENAHPQALLDCLAAYQSVVQTYNPRNIVLSGDSAGGQLAAALSLSLQHLGNKYGTEEFVEVGQRVIDNELPTGEEMFFSALSMPPDPYRFNEKPFATSPTTPKIASTYKPRPTFDPSNYRSAGIRQPDSVVLFSPVCNVSPQSDGVSTLGQVADIDTLLPAKTFSTAMQTLFGLCKSVYVKPGSAFDPDRSIASGLGVSNDLYHTFGKDIEGSFFSGIRAVSTSFNIASTFTKSLLIGPDEPAQTVKNQQQQQQQQQQHDINQTAQAAAPTAQTSLETAYRPFGVPTILPLSRHITSNDDGQLEYYGKPLGQNSDNFPAVNHTLQSLTLIDTMINHYSASPNRATTKSRQLAARQPSPAQVQGAITTATTKTKSPTLDAMPPTFVVVGRNEMLLGDAVELLSALSPQDAPQPKPKPKPTPVQKTTATTPVPAPAPPKEAARPPSPYHIEAFSGFYTNECGTYLLPQTASGQLNANGTKTIPLSPLAQHRTITPVFIPSSSLAAIQSNNPTLLNNYTTLWKAYSPSPNRNFYYHPGLHAASHHSLLDATQVSRSYLNGLLSSYVVFDPPTDPTAPSTSPSPSTPLISYSPSPTEPSAPAIWDGTHYAKYGSILDTASLDVAPFTESVTSPAASKQSLKMIAAVKHIASVGQAFKGTGTAPHDGLMMDLITSLEEVTRISLNPDARDPPLLITAPAADPAATAASQQQDQQQDQQQPPQPDPFTFTSKKHQLLILPNMFHVFILLPVLPHSKQSINMATKFIMDNARNGATRM